MKTLPAVSIVVIDSDPASGRLAAVLLRDAGASVEVAPDAEQGLRQLDALHPRVVLIDLQLPHVNGLVLAKNISQLKWATQTHIVGVSTGNGDTARAALVSGCSAYVQKPFGEQLVSTVVQLVRKTP